MSLDETFTETKDVYLTMIGKRVRATLGENVLVGEVIDTELISEVGAVELKLDHEEYLILSRDWTIEPVANPALDPAAHGPLTSPEREHTDTVYVLEMDKPGPLRWNEGRIVGVHEVEVEVLKRWRVIPGPTVE